MLKISDVLGPILGYQEAYWIPILRKLMFQWRRLVIANQVLNFNWDHCCEKKIRILGEMILGSGSTLKGSNL